MDYCNHAESTVLLHSSLFFRRSFSHDTGVQQSYAFSGSANPRRQRLSERQGVEWFSASVDIICILGSDILPLILPAQNLTTVLHELGTRAHKVLLEHIRQQSFNNMGGVQLTCDLVAYDKTFALLGVSTSGGDP